MFKYILGLSLLVAFVAADGHKGMMKKKMMMFKKLYKMSKNLEYYMVDSIEDTCGDVPSDVMMGNPKKMACMDSDVGEEVCMCVRKPPEMLDFYRSMGKEFPNLNEETGFMAVCGTCKDPCALKWMMDMDEMEKEMKAMLPPPSGSVPMFPDIENAPRGARALMNMAMKIMGKSMKSMCGSSEEDDDDDDMSDMENAPRRARSASSSGGMSSGGMSAGGVSTG